MKAKVQAAIDEYSERTVFKSLGIKLEKLDAEETIVSLEVDDRHRQHFGLVHGGIYVLLAETAASLAAACALSDEGTKVVGIEINGNHVRSVVGGTIRARSKSFHRGSRLMVYEAIITDGDEKIVSICRCTLMAIRA